MWRIAGLTLVSLLLTRPFSTAALDITGGRGEREMVRREREMAVTVTVEAVDRFISRSQWAPEDGTDARIAVQAAGNSGKPEFRPVLKRAAEAWSKAGLPSLTFYALHNLWRLGEPPQYFLENVRGYKRNPELALRSTLVWGRDATEESLVELTRIKDETPPNSPIRNWAYPQVRAAAHFYARYAKLKTMEDKVDALLPHAGAGFDFYNGEGGDPVREQDPRVYWARRELLALCKQEPEVVARRLLALDTLRPEGSSVYHGLREYLAQFLDEKAAAAYRRLKPPPKEAANRAADDPRPANR